MPPSAAANHRPAQFGLRRPRLLLALLPALLLLAALPLLALAQANPPHFFAGTVTVEGDRAADGVTVVAMIGEREAALTTVKDGRYTLKVPGAAGQTIVFKVGEWYAEESAIFEQGQRTPLNLTTDGRAAPPTSTPTPALTPTLTPGPTPAPQICTAQSVPPHFFTGTARLNGQPAPNGTAIAALLNGQELVAVAVAGGSYSLRAPQCNTPLAGQRISFTIGGIDTGQTAVWNQGGRSRLNLTASGRPAATPLPPAGSTPAPTPTPAPAATPAPTPTPYPTPTPAPPRPAAGSVAEAFAGPLANGSVLAIWTGEDEETGEPAPLLDTPEEFSEGNWLNRGDIIWIKLNRALEWEGQRLVTGWNLVRIP